MADCKEGFSCIPMVKMQHYYREAKGMNLRMLKVLALSPYLKQIGKTCSFGLYIIGEGGYQLLVEGNQHNTHTSTNNEWIW